MGRTALLSICCQNVVKTPNERKIKPFQANLRNEKSPICRAFSMEINAHFDTMHPRLTVGCITSFWVHFGVLGAFATCLPQPQVVFSPVLGQTFPNLKVYFWRISCAFVDFSLLEFFRVKLPISRKSAKVKEENQQCSANWNCTGRKG